MTWPQYKRRECTFEGLVVRLTPTECELLSTLLVRRGRVVSYGDIIEALWPDPECEPDWSRNEISQYRRMLRRKLPGVIECRKSYGLIIA